MSATTKTGAFDISEIVNYDADEDLHSVKMGIKTKKGLVLHYTVHGKSPEVAMNRAKFLARLLTTLRPDKNDNPWIKFDGSYDKEYYDVTLISGKVIENCYPNAGDFTVLKENAGYKVSTEIKGSQVSLIRLSNFDPFKKSINE